MVRTVDEFYEMPELPFENVPGGWEEYHDIKKGNSSKYDKLLTSRSVGLVEDETYVFLLPSFAFTNSMELSTNAEGMTATFANGRTEWNGDGPIPETVIITTKKCEKTSKIYLLVNSCNVISLYVLSVLTCVSADEARAFADPRLSADEMKRLPLSSEMMDKLKGDSLRFVGFILSGGEIYVAMQTGYRTGTRCISSSRGGHMRFFLKSKKILGDFDIHDLKEDFTGNGDLSANVEAGPGGFYASWTEIPAAAFYSVEVFGTEGAYRYDQNAEQNDGHGAKDGAVFFDDEAGKTVYLSNGKAFELRNIRPLYRKKLSKVTFSFSEDGLAVGDYLVRISAVNYQGDIKAKSYAKGITVTDPCL